MKSGNNSQVLISGTEVPLDVIIEHIFPHLDYVSAIAFYKVIKEILESKDNNNNNNNNNKKRKSEALDHELMAEIATPFHPQHRFFVAINKIKNKTKVLCSGNFTLLFTPNQNPKYYGDAQFLECFKKIGLEQIVSIAESYEDILIVTKEGQIYRVMTGDVFNLNLAAPRTTTPEVIDHLKGKNIVLVSSGVFFSLALTNDGKIYSWGLNLNGQLGRRGLQSNTKIDPGIITEELENKEIIKISSGERHSVCITSEGQVFGFGENKYGQLGKGNGTDIEVPIPIDIFGKEIVDVCAARMHTLFLTKDGKLYGCGSNSYGQLGLDKTRADNNGPMIYRDPIRIDSGPLKDKRIISMAATRNNTTFVLTEDGNVFSFGFCSTNMGLSGDWECYTTPTRLELDEQIIQMKIGEYHCVLISKNGNVITFGNNSHGQLGYATTNGEPQILPRRIPTPEENENEFLEKQIKKS